MPVTLTIVDHPAKSWEAVEVKTDNEFLEKACPAQHDAAQEILESSFSQSFLKENHVSASPNGFIWSAYMAYNQHHHLTIRPEDVWLAIISQFGFFIKKNSEKFRHLLVSHEGQKSLKVIDGSGRRSFGELVQWMAQMIFNDIKDPKLLAWVIPSFSTTTSVDHAVASVLLMGAMQQYYRFTFTLLCGIPSVTLAGEISDWEGILSRIDHLYQFGDEPSRFADMLRPILRYMILSFTDPTNAEVIRFWNTIVNEVPRGSGPQTSISGWMSAFCFWDEEGRVNLPQSWNVILDGVAYPSIPTDAVPAGSAVIPVTVETSNCEETLKCTLVAGSVGIQAFSPEVQQEDISRSLTSIESPLTAVQPVSGWWIFRNKGSDGDGTSDECTSEQASGSQDSQQELGAALLLLDQPNSPELHAKPSTPYCAGADEPKLYHDGNTIPLHTAIADSDTELVRTLLAGNANANVLNDEGYAPLHLAAKKQDSTFTRLLLEHGADPNIRRAIVHFTQESEITPLYIATKTGNISVVKELLKKCDVNAADTSHFWTPLFVAVQQGHKDIIKLLLAHGANVDGDRRSEHSPLFQAVLLRRTDLVEELCDNGADVNFKDEDGDTAIIQAAYQGCMDIVQLLLRSKIIDLRNASERPSWWYSELSGHNEITKLLKEEMARRSYPADNRKWQRDLINDSTSSFQEIGGQKLLSDIANAQRYIYAIRDPTNPAIWKERIRFVIQAPSQEDYDLEVIEPYRGGKDSDKPFIAVSYCWTSATSKTLKRLKIKVPKKDGSGYDVRETRANTDIIRRSLKFAHSKGINRVWIDQECIHQDDEEDKKALVPTMHRLYQQATLTLAILGRHIASLDDVEAIEGLWEPSTRCAHLRDRIFTDKWFRRAWTAQEEISTDVRKMIYLVGWADDFDTSGSEWKKMSQSISTLFPKQTIQRELVLDGHDKTSMSFFGVGSQHMIRSSITLSMSGLKDNFTLSFPKLDQFSWYSDNTNMDKAPERLITDSKTQSSRPSDRDYSDHSHVLAEWPQTDHHTVGMISAVSLIRGKRNHLTSDRLSILANISRYAYHLDVAALVKEQPHSSYSACIMAVAFANGDLSLIFKNLFDKSTQPFRFSANNESINSICSDFQTPNTLGSRCLSLGNPSFVINDKLMTRGVLWGIEACRDLLPLRDEIYTSITNCRTLTKEMQRHAGIEILKSVIKRLFILKRERLVELIVSLAVGWFKSPQTFHSTMEQLRNWFSEDADWPSHVQLYKTGEVHQPEDALQSEGKPPQSEMAILRLPEGFKFASNTTKNDADCDEEFDWYEADVDDSLIPDEWGHSPLLRWILLGIYHGMPLPVGSCVSKDGNINEYAIFQLNPNKITSVFVPLTELDYEFGYNFVTQYSAKGDFWPVQKTNISVSKEEKAQAQARFAAMNINGWPIAEKLLTIQGSRRLSGIWSPVLCANGCLKWDNKTKSYKMTLLEDSASYHFLDFHWNT